MATLSCICGHYTRLSGHTEHEFYLIDDNDAQRLKQQLSEGGLTGDSMNTFIVNEGQETYRCEECRRIYVYQYNGDIDALRRVEESRPASRRSDDIREYSDNGFSILYLLTYNLMNELAERVDRQELTEAGLSKALEEEATQLVHKRGHEHIYICSATADGQSLRETYVFEKTTVYGQTDHEEASSSD